MKTDLQRESLKIVKQMIKEGKIEEAYAKLYEISHPLHDFSLQHRYVQLFKDLACKKPDLKPIKIGVVATSTMEQFVDVLRFWLAKDGFAADIYLAEYNTMDQTILNPFSDLYKFKPDIIWLFSNYKDVDSDIPFGSPDSLIDEYADTAVARFRNLWNAIQKNSSAYTIQNNAELPLERIFGNFEANVTWGRLNFFRLYNLKLARATSDGVTIFDLDFLSSLYGKRFWFDERYWYHSKHAFALDAAGLIAFQMARLIKGIKGQAQKCIVLDLDHTLWGGVIGDDGLEGIKLGNGTEGEAYVDFQKYLLRLKERGIILTVCSKNDEVNAKLPFQNHPDMQIHLNDIAVFIANWNNKADNIRAIAEALDLGLDSFVFIDDNPVERDLVRGMLPMVAIPNLPEDPARYIRAIDRECYFETITFSEEDRERNKMYRNNAERKNLKRKFTDITDFLKSLEMKSYMGEFDDFYLPRIAQLINKSNQFHLTTTRYTEAQIISMMREENIICRYFKLKDRLGDNGLISVIILKKINNESMLIDTWVMSCRVLARGMEEFIQGQMLAMARKSGVRQLLGKYIPTKKNTLVADLYKKLGYLLLEEQNGITIWTYEVLGNSKSITSEIELVTTY